MAAPIQATVTLLPVDHVDEVGLRTIKLIPGRDSIKIGRSSKSAAKDLKAGSDNAWIDSPVLSREHASIYLAADGSESLYLEDEGSMHGTYVNDRRLQTGVPHILKGGEVVKFGFRVTRGRETFPARSFRIQHRWEAYRSPPTPPTSSYSVPEASDYDSELNEAAGQDSEGEPSDGAVDESTRRTVSSARGLGDRSSHHQDTELSSPVGHDLEGGSRGNYNIPGRDLHTIPDSNVSSSAGSLFDIRIHDDEPGRASYTPVESVESLRVISHDVISVEDVQTEASGRRQDDKLHAVDVTEALNPDRQVQGSQQNPMQIDDSDNEEPEEQRFTTVVEAAIPDEFGDRSNYNTEPRTSTNEPQPATPRFDTEHKMPNESTVAAMDGSNIMGDEDSEQRDISVLPRIVVEDSQPAFFPVTELVGIPPLSDRAPSPSDAAMPKPSTIRRPLQDLDGVEAFSRGDKDAMDHRSSVQVNDFAPRGFSVRPTETLPLPMPPISFYMETTNSQAGAAKRDIARAATTSRFTISRSSKHATEAAGESVAGSKRKAVDEFPESANADNNCSLAASFSEIGESDLDLPDAQPTEPIIAPSQSSTVGATGDKDSLTPLQSMQDERPVTKRAKLEEASEPHNSRGRGIAKVVGGAVVAGVGMFLALAAACPDPIV